MINILFLVKSISFQEILHYLLLYILLKWNSCYIKLTVFKGNTSVAFSMFTVLCNHCLYVVLKYFYYPKIKPIRQFLLIASFSWARQPPVCILFPWSYLFYVFLSMESDTICDLQWVTFSLSIVFLRFIYAVVWFSTLFFLWLITVYSIYTPQFAYSFICGWTSEWFPSFS